MKRILLVFLMLALSLSVLAQETNCGNGIDDDGDGFIDCFDSNCANSVSCKDFYVGRDKLCQVPPTGAAQFEMKLGAKSPDRTTWTSARMVVGDLDNDGIPEVVTLHHTDKKLYILDGRDLSIKHTGDIVGTAEYFDHTIGNIKGDNCAEIFIAEKQGSTFYISSYDCKGVLLWSKPIYGQPITMGLADFDEDGKVELYYRNEILDAETGTRLVKGSGTWTTIDAGPVAVDMLDNAACTNCAGLELVLGGNIYAVNLGARTADAGTLTLAKSIPAAANYFPKNTSFGWVTSLTSVADYNQDGSLDVLMSGATGSTGGTTTVFFWDVKNNTYKRYQPTNNWQHGTGRLNVADIDGDGKSNATFVSGSRVFALKDDFTLLWSVNINEGTSGYTGTTVFDFNNDNAVEIVYRDEAYLYIINGKTGSVFTQATCRSRTANDYPIVVDVDGDGSTEICVTCATNDTDNINDINRAPYGQVRTYKSNLEAWVPARKVWNQHGYFNVNVNDDLTIPRIQQKHHLVFSTGSCTTGPNRALNTFLNQSPFLDSKGCPTYASADVTYDANSVQITPPTCPDQAFTVSLDIRNIGDLGLSGTLPITFYQGNPTQAGAVKLNTVNVNLTKFNVGDVVSLSNLSVQGTGSTFTLYVVLNDNGSTVPTPIKLPNSTFLECNYTNNIVSAGVNPNPFSIQTALISNDIKCGTNPTSPNGAAEVFRLVGTSKETVGYTFYWFDGAAVADTSAAVFKGPVRTGLAAGTYSIVAYHKGVKCGSTSAQVTVGQQTRTLTAAITEDKPFTSCKNPDGKLTVRINGGDPFGNFTYQWFEGNVFGTSPILSTSHVITNVSAVTYSVLVTEKSTGCQILESAKVTDNTVKPVVSATSTEANCSPANTGSASANVAGNTNQYNFYWYNGSSVKPAADFTGSTYTNISAGDYTVVATSKSDGCSSAPLVVTVGSKQSVPVTTTVTAQQTSCTTPNGSASALVSGTTAGYTFKWFRGNNTLVANLIGNSSTISGLAAGVYTVEATSTSNGCVDTEIVTINDVIVIPVLTANVTSQLTQCSPLNGAASANVSGAGSFTYYWFNGNIGTPDTLLANYKGASYTGLSTGYYTVVAVNKATRCASARGLVQVLDNTVNPTITTSFVNQTSCNAATPNGHASANVGGVTAGYKFRWFTGADTTAFITQAASITNRASGTYTVKAVNTATKCYSTRQVTISDVLVNPSITSTIVNNINCTGVTPTGSITIQVNGGVDPITDFTIQWYEGNGTTTPLGTTVGSAAGTNKEIAQGLSAGIYTLRVTDNTIPGNGCSTTTTFTITNTPAVVTVDNADIVLTPQSNCSPVNGSATVNEITVNGVSIGNTTGYTFTWYQSNGTTVIPGSGAAAMIGTQLAAGTYFVRATNAATNCASALSTFTITDTHVNPAVTAASTINNTNCSGATPNGSITINIGGVAPVAGQYNIEWFEGNGTTTTLGTTVGSVSGASNETAQNLNAGTYTVRVTDLVTPDNGCSTTTTFTITDTPVVVTVDNADIALTPQSNCSPVNGSATVNEITVNGVGIGNTTGYTFTWYQSNGSTVIPGSGTAATIGTALAAGNYFVRATNTATNCTSAVSTFTITDTHVNPAVTAATTINNTNCTGSTPNGSITINIGGVAPVAGQHTIEWFEGNGTTTTLGTTVGSVSGASNETAQNLRAGTYTVRVTDLVTPDNGCSTTTTFTITDTPAVVTVDNADIVLTPQSNCSPVNGSATVNEITVNGVGIGNTTGYTFTWYQSNGSTVIPGSGTAATIGTALAAGNYFVRATNTATNCTSAVSTFTITDTHVNPAVTAATTINNTNCTGSTPNGSITINIGGVAPVAGQHTIEWFEGNGTTVTLGTTVGSVSGASNETAQNLNAGTYTVRVTDLVTPDNGCSTTTTFTITDTPAVVTVDNADIVLTPQSNCSPVNGSATVNEITVNGVGIGNTTGYTFTWYQSNGSTVIPGSGTAATIGTALAAGNYFVRATNTATNCTSAVSTFTITDTHVNPAVTAATINNTNCTGSTPNGSITINIGGVAPVAGQHTIEWFEGNGTTVTLGTTVGSVSGASNETAQNLNAGTYTVRVTDLVTPDNGCSTTTTFTITDTPAVVTVDNADIVLTPQSNCSPVNGSATVNEITVNGVGIGNTTGYTFTWYQSNGTTVIPGSGTAAMIGTPLAAGNYFVQATNTATNCKSAITNFTINDTHVNPAVTAATTINNTNCTGSTPNGSITINIGGVAPVAGQHTIEWFEGNGTAVTLGTTVGSVSGASNETAQNLNAGTYTVRVTDLVTPDNGCATTTMFTITDIPAIVTVENADITLTPQSNCSPVNGSATVNEITVNGAGIGNTTGYTFTWYQSNGSTVIPGSGTAATIGTSLAVGTYFVKATNAATNCVSTITSFTIIDTHVNPVVALSASVDNTNCTGVVPNGSITIQINGGADPVTDFTIDWFEGNGTATPLGTTLGTTGGVNNEVAQALLGGTYTVRVRDNVTPNSGCSFTTTFTINDNLSYPAPNGTPTANTACDPAKANGSIIADVGGVVAGYTFHIFSGQNTLLINEVTTGPAVAANLKAGIYTVQAITNATGCSASTEVTITDNIVLPTIDLTATTNVISCSPPDGTASVTGVSIGALADYTFSWYRGNGLKAIPDFTGSTITGLSAGNYTVTASNNVLGCDVQVPVTVSVINDPSTLITINELPGEQLQPAVCNDGQGQLGVQASSPLNTLGFSFTWFQGDKNVSMILEGSGQNFPVNSNRISNAASTEPISSGLHTVIALDNNSGCQDSLTINLPYSDEALLVSVLTFPQTDCLAPDGAFEASITPSAGTLGNPLNAGLDQGWYELQIYQNGSLIQTAAGTSGLPVTDPIIVTGLATGNYTVLAVETQVPPLPGCTSVPNNITIGDSRTYPVIDPNILTDNKSCPGATSYNGSISLTLDGNPTPGAGYSYTWYDGKLVTDPVLPGANILAPGHTAFDIDGGFYTVEVTSAANNCKAQETLYLNNSPYIISIASANLTITDQSNCSPADGSAEVLDVLVDGASSGGTAGYTFQWFLNNGTTVIPFSSANANVGTPIGAANYFVQATNTTSNCASPLVQFAVDDVSVTPVITLTTSTDNTNCTGAPSNGSITIEVDGAAPGAGHTIQWYSGIGTASPMAGETAATISNLAAGDYTVEVTDILSPGNTCSSIATFTIGDDLPVFTIAAGAITVTNQTDCVANGSSAVTDILIDGVSNGGVAGFTFEWFDDLGAPVAGAGTTSIIGVPLLAGNYRVVATNTTSLCSSLVSVFTVDDTSVTPVITLTTSTDNTNCIGAPSNGSITIEVDGAAPGAGHTIQWYSGIGTASPLAGETAATISNLAAGDYTVEVTDILSPGNTCSSIATFTIGDDLPVFTIAAGAITVTNQTDCVANGSSAVTDILIDGVSNGGVAGFTFEWFDDLGAPVAGAGTTSIIGVPLLAGNYRVVATNTTSLCSSLVSVFTVDDTSVTPVITLTTSTDNTNCIGAPSNGSITIEVDGAAPGAGHTIQWYSGIGTASPLAGETAATISNLAAGDYTVEVTDILSPGNTCSSIATFTIGDDLPVFTIAAGAITVTNQTDCVANGSSAFTDILIDGVSNGGVAGFTFEWFDDLGAPVAGAGTTSIIGVPLLAGNYRVVATNTTSLCSSLVSVFTVDDTSVTPVITLTTSTDNTNCTGAPSNGSITIEVDGAAPGAGHTIQWYSGIGTASPLAGETAATISNLAAGDYTVEVTDILSPGNTCSSIATFTIGDDLPVFTIAAGAITVTNQTDCVANGSSAVTDILIDGVSNGGVAGFTFEWFDDLGAPVAGAGTTSIIGVPLLAGNYRVVATNTTSLCSSLVSVFTVDDTSVTPVITLTTSTDNTNCTGAPSNGSITIEVDGAAPGAGHTIQWYSGIGTASPMAGETAATISNLAAGDYTVEVTDILSPGNTCSSIATFTIGDDLPVFTIAAGAITVTNQTDCVANGSSAVTDILIDGVSNGGVAGFTFEWFDDLGAPVAGAGTTSIIGVPLLAGNYRVVATNTTSLCSSLVSVFTVDDTSVTPVITLTTSTDNTNCIGAPSNGSITIEVDGAAPGAGHTIQWYSGIGTASPLAGETAATISNLAAGDYTVEVTDILSPGNTCSSIATFTIGDDLPVFTIAAGAITVTNQTDCVANGSSAFTDILIDGVSNGGVAGFTFEWFDDLGAPVAGAGTTSIIGVPLLAGNYRVVATNTTSLCSSLVSVFTVDDTSVTPVITLTTSTDNTNCTGAPSNGSITIEVDGAAPGAGHTIQWYSGIGTASPLAGETAATISNLAAGDYTVEVTDILSPGNSCSTLATFTINNAPNVIGIENSHISITDNSDCLPINGSVTITDIIFNGLPVGNTAGYVFEWLQSDLTPVDPGNGPTVGVNLTAGNYYVRATHATSNCVSPLTPFVIEDVTQIPVVVAIADLDNIACNTNYTGQVSASVSEGFTNGITAGYTFDWFLGKNNTNPADYINSGAVLTGLQEGDYTVRVTDTSTPSGNCVNTATLTIEREIPILNGTLTANAQTVCAPIQDGNMTVNNIQQFLGGASTSFDMNFVIDRNQFSFQWFDATLAAVSPVVNGNHISPNLEEGTFYVQVSDALGCTSDYIIGVIDDNTAKPQIQLDEFVNPAVCILPEVRGSLFVSADNHANFSDYTFEWFEGNSTAGTLVEPNSSFLGNIAYTGVLDYTVRVTNNATQCFSLETYKFKTDTVDIQVVASAVPLTSCVTDNGSLFAATRTGSGQLYSIEWYIGTGVGTTPDFTSNEVLIAPIGTYTVIAKHPTLNFCNSIPDTISVTDERSYPQVVATQKAPLTYCDPANPNGVAFATVNGGVIGYNFDWYEGSLSGNSIYTGSEAGILKATTYFVRATDVISGCPGTTSITIENDPLATPLPQITLLSNRTDCVVLDGALSAHVNGLTKDHVFNWYNGASIKNQIDASGEIYSDLDAGVYTLTATDRISGCTSGGVQREVIAVLVYPEFDIKTVNTNCDEFIGTAEINVSGEVEVKAVEWDIQGAIEFGPQVSDLPAGVFTVTAISFKNCETSQTFEIKRDISIYNAVSKNNDGMNDIFEVGCISDYPNNSVRIFNRAGTLVYEAGGYDNQDIYFNGISNRGVNILGNDLPDGTYFYIISKGDGSEPKTGYLELLH